MCAMNATSRQSPNLEGVKPAKRRMHAYDRGARNTLNEYATYANAGDATTTFSETLNIQEYQPYVTHVGRRKCSTGTEPYMNDGNNNNNNLTILSRTRPTKLGSLLIENDGFISIVMEFIHSEEAVTVCLTDILSRVNRLQDLRTICKSAYTILNHKDTWTNIIGHPQFKVAPKYFNPILNGYRHWTPSTHKEFIDLVSGVNKWTDFILEKNDGKGYINNRMLFSITKAAVPINVQQDVGILVKNSGYRRDRNVLFTSVFDVALLLFGESNGKLPNEVLVVPEDSMTRRHKDRFVHTQWKDYLTNYQAKVMQFGEKRALNLILKAGHIIDELRRRGCEESDIRIVKLKDMTIQCAFAAGKNPDTPIRFIKQVLELSYECSKYKY